MFSREQYTSCLCLWVLAHLIKCRIYKFIPQLKCEVHTWFPFSWHDCLWICVLIFKLKNFLGFVVKFKSVILLSTSELLCSISHSVIVNNRYFLHFKWINGLLGFTLPYGNFVLPWDLLDNMGAFGLTSSSFRAYIYWGTDIPWDLYLLMQNVQ